MSKQVHVRLTVANADPVQRLAELNQRSVNQMVNILVTEALKHRRFITAKPEQKGGK